MNKKKVSQFITHFDQMGSQKQLKTNKSFRNKPKGFNDKIPPCRRCHRNNRVEQRAIQLPQLLVSFQVQKNKIFTQLTYVQTESDLNDNTTSDQRLTSGIKRAKSRRRSNGKYTTESRYSGNLNNLQHAAEHGSIIINLLCMQTNCN